MLAYKLSSSSSSEQLSLDVCSSLAGNSLFSLFTLSAASLIELAGSTRPPPGCFKAFVSKEGYKALDIDNINGAVCLPGNTGRKWPLFGYVFIFKFFPSS